MFLNRNIRYIRELRGFTQKEFADHLDINRGNVASYEMNTNPPLDVLVRIAEWYNISLDALVKTDLSAVGVGPEADKTISINRKAIAGRIKEVFNYIEDDIVNVAGLLNTSIDELNQIFNGKSDPSFEFLIKISENYPWLSLEWLIRGNGSMIGSDGFTLTKVAEPDLQDYLSNLELESLEKLLKRIIQRQKKSN